MCGREGRMDGRDGNHVWKGGKDEVAMRMG